MNGAKSWILMVVSVVAVLVLAGPPALGEECVLEGELRAAAAATVHPTGENPFRVALGRGTRVSARLSKAGIKLTVREAVSFEAEADAVMVWVNRRVVAANGQVTLSAASDLLVTRADQGMVFGEVALAWSDTGCLTTVDEGFGPVGVPCDAIGLADIYSTPRAPHRTEGTSGTVYHPRRWDSRLQIRLAPRATGPAVTLSNYYPAACDVEEMGSKDSWLHVRREEANARLTGWVEKSKLKAAPIFEAVEGIRRPAPDKCMIGFPFASSGEDMEHAGPATVKAGTVIGPGAWARVREDASLDIGIVRDVPEAAILRLRRMHMIPDANAEQSTRTYWIPAWIPRSAVVLQKSQAR